MKTKSISLIFSALCMLQIANAQNVSPLTGDFSYNVPLMTIPGPNGEQYPLSLSYSAGIGMEQQASLIALGWNINLPSIQRNTNGNPDDFLKSVSTSIKYYSSSSIPEEVEITGPVNYKHILDESISIPNHPLPAGFNDGAMLKIDMDISQSYRAGFGFAPAEMPAYDGYSFTGGLSGSFKPAYSFKVHDEIGGEVVDGTVRKHALQDIDPANSDGDLTNDVAYQGGVRIFHKETHIEGHPYRTYWESEDKHDYVFHSGVEDNDLAFFMGTDFEQNTAIQFFRNEELSSSYPSGFIEYDNWTTTDRSSLPTYGIGAFRVTDANGLTYHFSLPVYAKNEKYIQVALKEPGANPSPAIYDKIAMPNGGDTLRVTERNDAYAYEWKLIAITGPDYVDINNNHHVDQGDKGYWLEFNHILWEPAFKWRSPYYGWHTGVVPLPKAKWNAPYDVPKPYQLMGTVSMGEREIYYVQSIETSTHVAALAYEVRKDAVSVLDIDGKAHVQLGLRAIVLFNKEYCESSFLEWIDNEDLFISTGPSKLTNPSCSIPNYQFYLDHKSMIDEDALQSIHFSTDYSLCTGVPDNLDNLNGNNEVPLNFNTHLVTKWANPVQNSVSGKRTLKSIKFLGLNGIPLNKTESNTNPQDELSFGYGSANKNPAYAIYKIDYWGMYNASRNHWADLKDLSATDAQNADVWSLRTIEEAGGKLTTVNYESDEYRNIKHGSTSKPTRMIFLRYSGTNYSGAPSGNLTNGTGSLQFCNPNHKTLFFDDAEVDLGKTKVHLIIEYNQRSTYLNPNCLNCDRETIGRRYVGEITWPNALKSPANFSVTSNGAGGTLYTVSGLLNSGYEKLVQQGGSVIPSSNGTLIGAYLIAHYDKAYGGGIRVASMTTTDLSSNENYSTEYDYEDGVATSEPKDYDFFGHVHNSLYASDFSGIAPMVAYGKVKLMQKGADDRNNGYVEKAFNVQTPIAKAQPHVSTNLACKIFIPSFILSMSLNQLTDTVLRGNENGKFYQSIPDLVKCHILSFPGVYGTKTNQVFLGGTLAGVIGYSTSVSNTMSCDAGIFYISTSALGDASICGNIIPSVNITKLWPYYTEVEDVYEVANSTVLHLYGQQFGQPLYEKTFSANNTLLSTATYEYEREGFYQERFKRNLLAVPTTDPAGGYYRPTLKNIAIASHINHYRYRQKKTVNFIDGIAATTTVLAYDASIGSTISGTNQPIATLTLNESVGGQSVETQFAFKSLSMLGKKVDGIWKSQIFTNSSGKHNRIAEPGIVLTYNYGLKQAGGLTTTYDINSKTLLSGAKNIYSLSLPTRNYSTSLGEMKSADVALPSPIVRSIETLDNPDDPNSFTTKSTVTLLSPDLKVLEERDDLTGLLSAVMYAHKLRLPIASIAGANYYSFSASSFESKEFSIPNSTDIFAEGEVKVIYNFGEMLAAPAGITAHSGSNVVRVRNVNAQSATNAPHIKRTFFFDPPSNTRRFDEGKGFGIEPGRKYRTSVWLHQNSDLNSSKLIVKLGNVVVASVSGAQAALKNPAVNGWILLELEFETPSDANADNIVIAMINSNSTVYAYFDDFRFHPVNTTLVTNVYDGETGWVLSTLDNNNYSTKYVYDQAGRVISVFVETRNGIYLAEENEYEIKK